MKYTKVVTNISTYTWKKFICKGTTHRKQKYVISSSTCGLWQATCG